jgi:lipocalin
LTSALLSEERIVRGWVASHRRSACVSDNTTAQYSINPDGSIKVLNQGYNYVKKEWDSAEGKAKFIGSESEARLKVSFFGPFYGGYNVVDIDENYQNALIYGNSTEYMWILSRTKTIDEATKKKIHRKSQKRRFRCFKTHLGKSQQGLKFISITKKTRY